MPRQERCAAATLAVLIAAAVGALYARTGSFGYVFDDEFFIVENPGLPKGLTWGGLKWAFTTFYHANWHPMTWIAHLADRALLGPGPGPAHLVNAALHAGCSALLFLLLRRMTGSLWPGACAAGLWAVHPLRVESVAWVTERKDPLSALFWILALWSYLHYLRRPGAARYALLSALFALGLMTKPSVVTLPVILLLLDFWPLGRLRRTAAGGVPAARLLLEKTPLLALAAISSLVTVAAQRAIGAVMRLEAYPLPVRLENALVATATYLRQTVWPNGLAVYYPHPHDALPLWHVLLAAVVLAALTALALLAARRAPAIAAGWLWYLVTLLPVSGVIQVGAQAMADRFSYLPSIGLSIALAWGVSGVVAQRPHRIRLLASAAAAVCAALAAVSAVQIGHWRDNATLYRHGLAVTRDNWMLLNNYGAEIEQEGDLGGAIRDFREAVRLRPAFFAARMNLGRALEKAFAARLPVPGIPDHLAEAERQYREALALEPGSPEAGLSLGNLLVRLGRRAEAVVQFEELLALHPDSAKAQMNLAILLAMEGRLDQARPRFREAIRLDPASGDPHFNYGVALESAGRPAEAAGEYHEALQREPGHRRARAALERLGRSGP